MDLSNASTWLKTTVLGIIILGAVGSLVAGAVARVFWRPLSSVGLRLVTGVTSRLSRRAYCHGYVLGSLEAAGDAVRVIVYCAFHLCLFILATLLSLFCAGLFAIRVAAGADISGFDFVLVVLTFLQAWLAYSQFRLFSLAYFHMVVPVRQQAEKKYESKRDDDDTAAKA